MCTYTDRIHYSFENSYLILNWHLFMLIVELKHKVFTQGHNIVVEARDLYILLSQPYRLEI